MSQDSNNASGPDTGINMNWEALDRLWWPISGGLEEIQVWDDAADFTSPRQPLFPDHPPLSQLTTIPGRNKMLLQCENLTHNDWWHDADMLDQRPPPLVIEKDKDGPITIRDFVQQFHSYMIGLRPFVEEILAPEEMGKLFFDTVAPKRGDATQDPDTGFPVALAHEGSDLDYAWNLKSRRHQNAPVQQHRISIEGSIGLLQQQVQQAKEELEARTPF